MKFKIIIIKIGKNKYDNKFGGNIMEKICPVCNNLERKICNCEKCSAIMDDKGIIQEFLMITLLIWRLMIHNEFCVHIYQ